MTNASDESGTGEGETTGITDEQLPEDLVPGEDNPLAEPLPDGESMDLGVPEPGEQRDAGTGSDDEDDTQDDAGD
jgi:hypothetical protein